MIASSSDISAGGGPGSGPVTSALLKVGGAADMVVLDANPLDDIANVRRIAYVVSRGRVEAGGARRSCQSPR